MRAISSVRMTVLPSPAPPNRPALPPRANGREQVDDLDAGLEQLGLGRELVERGGGSRWIGQRSVRVDRAAAVDRLAEQVEDAAERLLADRHGDRPAGVDDRHAADQAVGRAKGDAADAVAARCCCTSPVRWILASPSSSSIVRAL